MNADLKFFRSIAGLALATGLLLMIPYVAMQFTTEVVWTISDFVVVGSLLFGTGFAYLLITRIIATDMADNLVYRIAVGVALFSGLFQIWVNLAVGITGSADNPANMIYFGVPVVGMIGAFIARFKPKGMANTMFTLALAQTLAAVFVLVSGMYNPSSIGATFKALGVNGFFVVIFVASALLFRYSGHSSTFSTQRNGGADPT